MEDDAELHAEEDKKLRELVDVKNLSEGMIHSIKKTMTDHPDKVEKDEKEKIEKAISDLEESLKSDNKDDIEAKNKILAEASQKLGEKIHADQQASEAQPKKGGKNKEKTVDAEVVDAEFEEVKKDDKKK